MKFTHQILKFAKKVLNLLFKQVVKRKYITAFII